MTLDREIIIDLLPAYFSGEASAATRELVENYFQHNPEFEKTARAGSWTFEGLKAPVPAPDLEKEKLAFERARLIVETRGSFLWLAVCFSVILLLFRVNNHKLVFIMWQDRRMGTIFLSVAVFSWLMYVRSRVRPEPLRAQTKFFWVAWFYTFLVILVTISGGGFRSLFQDNYQNVTVIMAAIAVATWITYFYYRWKSRGEK